MQDAANIRMGRNFLESLNTPIITSADLTEASVTLDETLSRLCNADNSFESAGEALMRYRVPGWPHNGCPRVPSPECESFEMMRDFLEQKGYLDSPDDSVRRYLNAHKSLIGQVRAAQNLISRDCFALSHVKREIEISGLYLPKFMGSEEINEQVMEAIERWKHGKNSRGSVELKVLIQEVETWSEMVTGMVKDAEKRLIREFEEKYAIARINKIVSETQRLKLDS
ncbi:hypothetical protein K440DRAFT_645229 [Wilcoxina mikolae CBS 423.85]|nr:hypothetical protein K440DRAFT_645229 [Wilcoxina mikolae CBS 423.85]